MSNPSHSACRSLGLTVPVLPNLELSWRSLLVQLVSVIWQKGICFRFVSHLKGIFPGRKIMSIPWKVLRFFLYSRSYVILFICEKLRFCLLTWETSLESIRKKKFGITKVSQVSEEKKNHIPKKVKWTKQSHWNLIATEPHSLRFISSQQLFQERE